MRRIYVLGLAWVVSGLAALSLAAFLAGALASHWIAPAVGTEGELAEALGNFFAARANALISGDSQSVAGFYDQSRTSGRYAYEHEMARIEYTSAWFRERRVSVTKVTPTLRFIAYGVEGNTAWASVCQQLLFTYHHSCNPPETGNTMGTRTIHWVELVKDHGVWHVNRDWFWDPFKDDTLFTGVAPFYLEAPHDGFGSASPPAAPGPGSSSGGRLDRGKATAYADKYCGVRILGGSGRYNLDYRDFTGVGGDCANFVSQVLADPSAGGMRQDWSWFTQGSTASSAWLRADHLTQHLLNTGSAVLVARGNLQEVSRGKDGRPGPVFSLEPADVIAYARKGDIVHVSVVVGKDAAGYPIVNSHSGDRYHVPWDLGYDSHTTYWLLHIVY